MRVLVTGAAGFIGSHLTRVILRDGHEVWGAVLPGESTRRLAQIHDRTRIELIDLEKWPDVKELAGRIKPDCCVHQAWYVVPGKFWDSPQNLKCVSMSLGLAEALAAAGCRRMVGVGSCAEYDWDHQLLSEDATPLRPRTLYGVCKNATRQILEGYCAQARIEFAWVRYFYLYGPGEKAQRLVPSVIRAMLRGQPAKLNSGSHVRDFLHVRDVAAATWEVANSALTGAVNIASGESVSTRTIVETIAKIMGENSRLEWGAIPDGPLDVPVLSADVRKLKQATNWAPSFSLEEGLRETIDWWRSHIDEGP